MIRAAFRLLIVYALAWLASLHIDRVFQLTVDVMRWLADQLAFLPVPWQAPGVLFLVALTIAGLQLPLWICTVRVDPLRGPRRHPFARLPLRRHLRLRPARFFLLMLLHLAGLLLMLRALPVVFEPAGAVPFSWLLTAGQLSDRDTWLFYGLIHLVAVLVGWVMLMVVAELFAARWPRPYGFVRYQFVQAPVSRMLVRLIALGMFPVAAFAATSHAHPMFALVVMAMLLAVLIVSVAGQVLTLRGEARNERWLDKLDAGFEHNDAVAVLRQRTIAFLHPATGGAATVYADNGESDNPEPTEGVQTNPATAVVAGNASPVGDPWAPPGMSSAGQVGQGGLQTGSLPSGLPSADPLPSSTVAGRSIDGEMPGPPGTPGINDAREGASGGMPDGMHDGEQPVVLGRQPRGWLRRGFSFSVTAVAVLLLTGIVAFAYQWVVLPSDAQTRVLAASAHVHVRRLEAAPAGEPPVVLLGTRYDYSLGTSIDNVSPHFINAVIASEDHRFFEHGVVYKLSKFAQAAVRCVWRRVSPWVRARACRGNSTIGQQLARNLFLSEERSLVRKFRELVWSIKMETTLTKREILQAYLNRIYLGRGNFGVEMAARSYFGKTAAQLGLHEAVLLAAAVKRPAWNWQQDRAGAVKRAKTILLVMRRYGLANESARFPDSFRPRPGQRTLRKPYLGHLWQWIAPQVEAVLADMPAGDYKLLTTLNAEVQVYAYRRLADTIRRMQGQGVTVSQGAVVVMRPNGAVLAMVGGVGDDLSGRGVNRAKRTDGLFARPPASAFKPFVYLAALESGLTPDSVINAAPVSIEMPGGTPYEPTNHDGKAYGSVSLRDALVHSINTAAVRLLREVVGFDRLLDVTKRLGLKSEQFQRQWGLALGQSGVPVVDMAGAYAAFANGGYRVMPHAFVGVTDPNGRTVWQRPSARNRRVIARGDVSALNSMLRDAVSHGTGFRARRRFADTVRIAGKTGTGDNFVDAWFIGYTGDLVIAVWLGNDRPQSMKNTFGGGAPARIFNDILHDLDKHTGLLAQGKPIP